MVNNKNKDIYKERGSNPYLTNFTARLEQKFSDEIENNKIISPSKFNQQMSTIPTKKDQINSLVEWANQSTPATFEIIRHRRGFLITKRNTEVVE